MESGFVSLPEDWKLNNLNVYFVSNIPPYPKQKALFKCSDVLPICSSDDSSNKIKISIKQCFN